MREVRSAAGAPTHRGPRAAANEARRLSSSVRIHRAIDAPALVRRSAVGSPGGFGSSGVRGTFGVVGGYEFRVKRRDGEVSDEYAIRRARETAFADGSSSPATGS